MATRWGCHTALYNRVLSTEHGLGILWVEILDETKIVTGSLTILLAFALLYVLSFGAGRISIAEDPEMI